jgi:hypothetical protein
LIDLYVEKHRPNALREKEFFETMPSIELAIYHAAFALDHRDPPKRYSHQRRIRLTPMRKAHRLLSQSRTRLADFKKFDELHEMLRKIFLGIPGLGPLYTYDTAQRIGFYLKFAPEAVYLHAGTQKGARALGIRGVAVVTVDRLPKELRVLPAHEIENFLCIFKPRAER